MPRRPAGIRTRLAPLRGISAVLFDVYGTLLLYEENKLSPAEQDRRARLIFRRSGFKLLAPAAEPGFYPAVINKVLREIRAEHRRKKARGIRYPEVDIIAVWRRAAGRLGRRRLVRSGRRPDWRQPEYWK